MGQSPVTSAPGAGTQGPVCQGGPPVRVLACMHARPEASLGITQAHKTGWGSGDEVKEEGGHQRAPAMARPVGRIFWPPGLGPCDTDPALGASLVGLASNPPGRLPRHSGRRVARERLEPKDPGSVSPATRVPGAQLRPASEGPSAWRAGSQDVTWGPSHCTCLEGCQRERQEGTRVWACLAGVEGEQGELRRKVGVGSWPGPELTRVQALASHSVP